MNNDTPCPCSSGLTYEACCKPIVTGEVEAHDPESLMRSRYTAYALEIIPHLARTLHPSQRHDYDEAGAAKWAREAVWDDLEIVAINMDPSTAGRGTVEFKAHYKRNSARLVHHELAEFRKTDGTWYFYDGKMVGSAQIRREAPKIGRNEPCPCGSGRKYKKCCGRGA